MISKFDFNESISRRDTNSYKWDVAKDELPMWVADMDFETAPAVLAALEKRISQKAFGYNTVPREFKNSIKNWWYRRHHFDIQSEWILFCTGVVPAISSIVRKMTEPEDHIVVISPVYNIFYNSILNNGRKVLASEMVYSDEEYEIDFYDLEEKLSRTDTTLLIFCNPHNPTGKVWSREILNRVGELCLKHQVLLLSDEIHCDLTHSKVKYIPTASVSKRISENTITCVAPTKTFNLAGLQTSAIIIANPRIRELVDRGINTDEVAEPNTFAIQAAVAAFNEGEQWLADLNDYLEKNRNYIEQFIGTYLPELKLVSSEATYLAWVDCSKLTDVTDAFCDYLRAETGLILSAGNIFGGNGNNFVRINYATTQKNVEDGMERLYKGVLKFKEKR